MTTQKLLTLGICLCGLSAFAQPVLQNNVFPDLGDNITTVFADTAGVNPGPAGANQNWDFSNLFMTAPMGPVTMVTAASTPFAADFPFANLCGYLFSDPDNYYFYYRKEASQLSYLGSAATYGVLLQYTDPETLLKAPLGFGESFTDDYARFNTFPDNTLYGSAHKTATYDAYGTLKTPLGTFQNAMRLHTVTAFRDTTWLFAGYSINEHTDVSYEWFVPNRPLAQVSITYSTGTTTVYISGQPANTITNEPSKIVQFVKGLTTGTKEPFEGAFVATSCELNPNPVGESLHIEFFGLQSGAPMQCSLLDASGRTLRTERFVSDFGLNTLTLSVADFPPGAYFMYLTDGHVGQTLPWQKF